MTFDPDKYLAQSKGAATAQGFDPDAYLGAGQTTDGPSTLDIIGRKLGLGARSVTQGLAQIPGMVYDAAAVPVNAGIAGYNALTGSNQRQIPPAREQVRGALDAVGLPKPETRGERIVSAINEGGAAALPTIGLGAVANIPAMSTQAASQVASGMGAGAGSQAAEEMGYGPVGQVVGGITGAVAAPAITAGISRVLAPGLRDEIERFISRGGTPTIGQMTGNQQIDDAAARLPGMRGLVEGAKERTSNQFTRMAGDEVLSPMGSRLSPTASGNAIPAEIKTVVDAAYKNVAPKFTAQIDDAFRTDISGVIRIADRLDEGAKSRLLSTVNQELASVPMGQKIDGGKLLELKRSFRDLAYDAQQEAPELAKAYREIEGAVGQLMKRTNAGAFDELSRVDAAYSRYLPVRNAAAKAIDGGQFTPQQLARGSARYGGEEAAASGRAPMQQTAQMGIDVMGPRSQSVPQQNFGFWEAANHPFQTAAGYLRAPLYTETGQNLMARLAGPRPDYALAVAQALRYPSIPQIGLAATGSSSR